MDDRLLSPLRRRAPAAALAVAFLACEATADLLQPTLMAQLVNRGVLGRDADALGLWGAAMLAAVALGALCALGRNWLASVVSQGYGVDLRDSLFAHVLGLRLDQARRWESAALLTRLTFDVNQVQNLVNGSMRLYLKAPLLGLGALVLAFATDPLLALVVVPVLPVVFALFAHQLRRTLPLFQRSQELLDELGARLRDFLHGLRIIQGFGRQDHERERFDRVNADLAEVSTRTQVVQAVFSPAVTLTVSLTVAAVLAVGGATAGEGRVGHLMAFVQYLTQLLFALIVVSNLVGVFSRARTSAGRLDELFATPPEPRVVPRRAPEGVALELRGVSAAFGGEPVLREVSFSVRAGGTLGLLGSTGSGKTTLLQALQGFVPVTGEVLVAEGTRFGAVPQRPLLFSGSVRDNLSFGEHDDASLWDLLEVADAAVFVRAAPDGLDAKLGPGGINLSGGQRQRLTLARALASRPTVLLLDEAFSALDAHTEARVEARLGRALPGAARLLVAQKVSSVRHLDAILVLDDGRVDGWGTHEQLWVASPVYRQICRSQGVE